MAKLKRRKFIGIAIASGLGALATNNSTSAVQALQPVRLGFIDLVNSAPLIIAQAKGYFQGMPVKVVRQADWELTKTELQSDHLDGAYVLVPLPNQPPRPALSLRADFVETDPQRAKAIAQGIQTAQIWCDQPQNQAEMYQIISQRQWFNPAAYDQTPEIYFSKIIRISDRLNHV